MSGTLPQIRVVDGLQGYGHIAREAARVLKAMNVNIIAANSRGCRQTDDGVSACCGLEASSHKASTFWMEQATRKVGLQPGRCRLNLTYELRNHPNGLLSNLRP